MKRIKQMITDNSFEFWVLGVELISSLSSNQYTYAKACASAKATATRGRCTKQPVTNNQ